MGGQTGHSPIILAQSGAQSGNIASLTRPENPETLSAERNISANFQEWLDSRASSSHTSRTMLRSGAMPDKSGWLIR